MFSIIIPTFNNLNYLKLCLKSIVKNSFYNHEIIIHINDGSDGTFDYVKEKKYLYSYSKKNFGMCDSLNQAAKLASSKYLVFIHDDMYVCPNWDIEFYKEASKYPENKNFFLSGVMIQPFKSFINFDCGKTFDLFNEKKLLDNFNKIKFDDFQGTHWQPSLIPRKTWDMVDGFSEEFNPGSGSDPDFNMKLWDKGVRIFKGLSSVRVYHFGSMTLRKKVSNKGNILFLLKWGISIKFFKKYYLRSNSTYKGELNDPERTINYYLNYVKCRIIFYYYKLIKKHKL